MLNKKTLFLGAFSVIAAIIIGLLASSFKKLATEEVGIKYDVFQRTLKDKLNFAGLYSGPPGFKFITFSRVYETLLFKDVKCLNKDGLHVALSVQFQYLPTLSDKNIRRLIIDFQDNDNFKKVLFDTALEVIHNACSKLNVTQFQTARVAFQDSILTSLNDRLTKDYDTAVKDVQVNNIERPSEYEQVVRDKESAKQNIDVKLQERPRILTAAITKRLESETQANITLNKARTDARVLLLQAEAQSKAILKAYETEADTYSQIMIKQNLTTDGVLSYLLTRAIQTVKKPLHVNVKPPT